MMKSDTFQSYITFSDTRIMLCFDITPLSNSIWCGCGFLDGSVSFFNLEKDKLFNSMKMDINERKPRALEGYPFQSSSFGYSSSSSFGQNKTGTGPSSSSANKEVLAPVNVIRMVNFRTENSSDSQIIVFARVTGELYVYNPSEAEYFFKYVYDFQCPVKEIRVDQSERVTKILCVLYNGESYSFDKKKPKKDDIKQVTDIDSFKEHESRHLFNLNDDSNAPIKYIPDKGRLEINMNGRNFSFDRVKSIGPEVEMFETTFTSRDEYKIWSSVFYNYDSIYTALENTEKVDQKVEMSPATIFFVGTKQSI